MKYLRRIKRFPLAGVGVAPATEHKNVPFLRIGAASSRRSLRTGLMLCFWAVAGMLSIANAQVFESGIPTADILGAPGVKWVTRAQVFTQQEEKLAGDTARQVKFPVNGSVLIGLGERAQVGFHMGSRFSLSGKFLLVDARGRQWRPNVILGMQSLYSSQEAHLYHALGDTRRERLINEVFAGLRSKISQATHVHFGMYLNPRTESWPFSLFAGFHQNLAGGVFAGYESFQRFSGFHHRVYAGWSLGRFASLAVSLNELQSWIWQDGQAGPHFSPVGLKSSGYDNPGVGVQLSVRLGKTKKHDELDSEKLSRLEKEQAQLRSDLKSVQLELKNTQSLVRDMQKARTRAAELENSQLEEYLSMIVKRIYSDYPFDPEEVAGLRQKVLAFQDKNTRALESIVGDASKSPEMRAQAIIIMGQSQKSDYDKALLQSVQDPNPMLRREAILALGKMSRQTALEQAENLLTDPDSSVSLAAREVLKALGRNPESSGGGGAFGMEEDDFEMP